ncbi:hypothetical protein JZO70_04245 [Enterococcus sp. 669A]|uniref:Uncharacterized protein n=1 Tax=Candidatus Enterococcus moelleringii TaxID=2815325 RepID=A0ABS3L8D2_9ENTE|nr:hypothetical protein [Enterococcus sp. 669A]MBO1305355.1 hypothetical protein [Enterococcus sp. 669A]
MKRNKILITLLFLVFLTASSYTLAKFTDRRTYVIGVSNTAVKVAAPAVAQAEQIGEDLQPAESNTEAESIEDESSIEPAQLSPRLIFESDSVTSEQEELSLQEDGIYAIQLYGDALEDGKSSYLAGYLTYTADKKLSYQLGMEEPIDESGEVAESDSTQELPKVSQLFQAETTDPIMQVEASEPSLNQKFITEIPEDSKLHELLSPKEERTTSKIIVTYLGPISEVEQIEELNQAN